MWRDLPLPSYPFCSAPAPPNPPTTPKSIICDSYNPQSYPSNLSLNNCILWDGGAEIWRQYGWVAINITYSDICGGFPGLGNIDLDPCFVAQGYWADPCNTPGDPADDLWVVGDYHLKSFGWRWDSSRQRWDYDEVTSRCIDAGNPGAPLAAELLTVPADPTHQYGLNRHLNMGAYGGTAEASMPPHDWALLADLTNDGFVDLADYAPFTNDFPDIPHPADLNRDGAINLLDLTLQAADWLAQTSWHQ